MIDRFEDMRTFIAVVENRSFANAATQLGVVKSAVSRRIRDLESRLNARLLNRTTRQLNLTETGSAFFDRCVTLLAAVEEAEEAASQGAARIAGRMRISAPMSFGIHCLTPHIGAFIEQHPGLVVDLDLNDRIIDLVREGFDLAVRISRLKDSTLVARRIVPIRHALCASPAYLDQFGTPSSPDDLKAHKGIVYSNVDSESYWQLKDPKTGSAVSVDVPYALKLNNGDAMREAAIAGFGIAALPTFIIHRAVKAGDLKIFLTDYERPAIALYAVYPSARHVSGRVRSLIDFLVKRFGPTPPWDDDVFQSADDKSAEEEYAVFERGQPRQ